MEQYKENIDYLYHQKNQLKYDFINRNQGCLLKSIFL
ncbi:hypothetical protein AsAng_0043170 [Aureispira anguillae]|uniref:Uncharacterized protein n=1 Tax=Aureispira anguillae TaxID=2864201 RepID=A0A915YIN9_9BACT|nr:hypothetical protein AsAng_0043170 [Aureispira anguillae]